MKYPPSEAHSYCEDRKWHYGGPELPIAPVCNGNTLYPVFMNNGTDPPRWTISDNSSA